MKYSEVKYTVKEMRRLVVEDMLRKHPCLFEFVEADKKITHNIIKFWWKSSVLRNSIKHILKGGTHENLR